MHITYLCRLTKNSTYSAFIRIFGNEYFFPWLCDEMSYFYKISYFYLTFRKFAISSIQIHFLRPQKGNSSPWILKKWSLPHKKIYYRLPCNLPYYDRVGWFFFLRKVTHSRCVKRELSKNVSWHGIVSNYRFYPFTHGYHLKKKSRKKV